MDSRVQLTDQQRQRITQNFRAAKIIRDRKRSQANANSLSPFPSPASPWTGNVDRGRFSLGSSSHPCVELRGPIAKKKNNTLSPGQLHRKALTELKGNQTGQAIIAPQDFISVRLDFLDAGPQGTSTENFNIQKENQRTPITGKYFSTKFESNVAYRDPTKTSEQCCVGGLSQIFDESLLHEVDAQSAQKGTGNGSIETSAVPLPNTPSQNDCHRFVSSTTLVTEAHCSGVEIQVECPRALQEELPSGYLSDGLHLKEIVQFKEPSKDVAIHFSPVSSTETSVDKSQAGLTAKSLLSSELPKGCRNHLNVGISGDSNAARAADIYPSSTSSVVVVSQVAPPYLQKLNDSQREAATSDTTKPLLILAGPGSGKTSTMVARLLTFIQEGVQPANILAMTFTTAAATEMRDRVAASVGKTVSKELAVSTFHSFCLQLCRSHADKLGRTSEFLVFGPGQQRKAIVEATKIAMTDQKAGGSTGLDDGKLRDNNPALWKEQARKFQQIVIQAKCAGKTSTDLEKTGNALAAAVLRNYEKTLAACDALDYHDFIICAVKLLSDHPEVLENCQRTWPCILVDEFQDTSTMQYRFLRVLASHNRITIVGDDDQSIFGFNGANSTGFDSFRIDFADYKEVRLHQNYRSTRSIVEAASALIMNNFKRCQTKRVFTDNILGDKIAVRECRNEPAQCALVVDCILMNNASSPFFSSTAVLYRRQVTGKLFQSTFRARKIPFNVHGVSFYRKKVIKNITALLWTVVPGRRDIYEKRVFKALFAGDKSDIKKAVEYVEKIAKGKNCSFLQAASEIFSAKISGTFTRRQLALGKRVLASIRTVSHLVGKEQSLSAVITAAASLLPQRPVFDKRAVETEDGRKLLNEDEDPRTV